MLVPCSFHSLRYKIRTKGSFGAGPSLANIHGSARMYMYIYIILILFAINFVACSETLEKSACLSLACEWDPLRRELERRTQNTTTTHCIDLGRVCATRSDE